MTFNAPVEPVRCIEESVGLNHGHAHEHQCVAAVCHDGQGGCAMVLERELTSSSISSCETTSSLEGVTHICTRTGAHVNTCVRKGMKEGTLWTPGLLTL